LPDDIFQWGEKNTSRFSKSYYWDPFAGDLARNVSVFGAGGKLIFRMNDGGFKAVNDINPALPIVAVYGDSVAFGQRLGWVELMNDLSPEHQFVCGAVEGAKFFEVIEIAEKKSAEISIHCNVIMAGWHGWHGARHDRLLWRRARRLRRPVFVTMPTLLNEDTIDDDWDRFLPRDKGGRAEWEGTRPSEVLWGFWGDDRPEGIAVDVLRKIVARNATTRRMARTLGAALCDLEFAFRFKTIADGVKWFKDIGHMDRAAYPLMARTVWEVVQNVV
jgi:hypothetical protein